MQGAKVKLPVRKGREGKVLGRAIKEGDSDGSDQDEGDEGEEGLVLRAADVAESTGFRALFSAEEVGALSAAAPFAGQVCTFELERRSGSCRLVCFVICNRRDVCMLLPAHVDKATKTFAVRIPKLTHGLWVCSTAVPCYAVKRIGGNGRFGANRLGWSRTCGGTGRAVSRAATAQGDASTI